MAAPNIVGVTTVTAKTQAFSLSDTADNLILSNPLNSNKVFKVNSIIVANDDGTNAANITIKFHAEDNGDGTAIELASTIAVAADTTLVILDRASAIYLEEDKSLVAVASAANDLNVFVSYEEISS